LATKEALSKEALSKETISKEAIPKEAIPKEAIPNEAILNAPTSLCPLPPNDENDRSHNNISILSIWSSERPYTMPAKL
jgi:hypothetical protein